MFVDVDLAFSQTNKDLTEVRREIEEALKAGQIAIQKDLAEIKNLLLQKELQAIRVMFQAKQGPTPAPAQAPAAEAQTVVLSIDGGVDNKLIRLFFCKTNQHQSDQNPR